MPQENSRTLDLLRTLAGWALALALFGYGMWSFPLHLMGPERTMIPGDHGDARFINYLIEHFHLSLLGKTPGLWDAPFMYPWPRTVALSDNMWGTGPLYSLFRHIGFNRESAFQLWILSLFALNYWCCFLALRIIRIRHVIAASAAFIFAFGIFHFGHMNHAQVLQRFMIPFAVVLFMQWLRGGRNMHLMFAALAVVYQFYCSIYLAMFLLYALFFLAVAHAIIHRTLYPWKGGSYPWLAGVIAGSIILLLPLMLPYMEVARSMGVRTFDEVVLTVPRPGSYFFTHFDALSWRDLSQHYAYKFDGWWFHFLFMGGVPWAAVLALPLVLSGRRVDPLIRRDAGVVALALFLGIVFCMRFGDFSLFALVHKLPGFSALRVADRVILVLSMLFVLLLALVAERIPRRGWPAVLLAILLPVAVVLDNRLEVRWLKRFDKWEARNIVDDVVRHIQFQYDGHSPAIAFAPVLGVQEQHQSHERDIHLHITAMLAAQQVGLPVVNGYSSWYPPVYMDFFDHKERWTLDRWSARMEIESSEIQMINDLGVVPLAVDTGSLRTATRKFVQIDPQEDGRAITGDPQDKYLRIFRVVHLPGGRIALRANNDRFLAAAVTGDGRVAAAAPHLGDHGIFTRETAGDGWFTLRAHDGSYLGVDEEGAIGTRMVSDTMRFQLVRPWARQPSVSR